jgi:2'-5' RNA ligase
MARLRTFIGVDVGKAVRDRSVALQESLSREGLDLKWVAPANIHLTLLFLGEVNDRDIPDLCKAVSTTCSTLPGFTMSIEGIGCFPNPNRPRIVWAGVTEGSEELILLHDALEPPLLALGCYRREERQYTPHLTLGRVEGNRDHRHLARALERHADWHGGDARIGEVRVYSSELTRDGPIYAVLSRAALA